MPRRKKAELEVRTERKKYWGKKKKRSIGEMPSGQK